MLAPASSFKRIQAGRQNTVLVLQQFYSQWLAVIKWTWHLFKSIQAHSSRRLVDCRQGDERNAVTGANAMFTQRPSGGWNEEHRVCLPDGASIEAPVRPLLLPDPMDDGELEALVLAQCFSLARARARRLRENESLIMTIRTECVSGNTGAASSYRPERKALPELTDGPHATAGPHGQPIVHSHAVP